MPRAIRSLVGAILLASMSLQAGPARAAFPGTNGLIAWTRIFFHRDTEIWVMHPDGTGKHQLTHNMHGDLYPAWSPDGRWLATTSDAPGTAVDIFVVRADGTDERNLTHSDSPDVGAAWSPDQKWIAYYKQKRNDTSHLWVIRRDGTDRHQITFGAFKDVVPAWSPDGATIAFSSDRAGGSDIWLVDPDGSNLRRLTDTVGVHEVDPDWSPDGSKIAFDACVADSYPCPGVVPNYEIFTMDADGSHLKRLTRVPKLDTHPDWSPDGTQIVFRSDRAANGTQIWRMDADGSNVVQLTFKAFRGGVDPDWQARPTG
jgi:Tol biopolymer transport system component